MTDRDVISNLKSGGKKREEAYYHLLRHKKLRAAIEKRLKKFRRKLSDYFPTGAKTTFGQGTGQLGYVDFFLQEALIRLDQTIRREALKAEVFANIIGFLSTEAHFRCLDFINAKDAEAKKYENLEDVDPVASENPVKSLVDTEKYQLLRSVLEKLGTNCKEILLLFEDGYSIDEIAALLGYTRDSVKTKRSNCKKKLIDYLRHHPGTARFLGGKKVGGMKSQ